MNKQYRNCQSCSMPLKKDKNGGGTNIDGTKSNKYCSCCYEKGAFLNPEIDTAKKMQTFVLDKMKSMGFPSLLAKMFTKKIPKLERWRKNSIK